MGSDDIPVGLVDLDRGDRGQREYTVEEYAAEVAPYSARANRLSEAEAEEGIRNFMEIFVERSLKEDKELEFPYASGIFFRRTGPGRFSVTYRHTQGQTHRGWCS